MTVKTRNRRDSHKSYCSFQRIHGYKCALEYKHSFIYQTCLSVCIGWGLSARVKNAEMKQVWSLSLRSSQTSQNCIQGWCVSGGGVLLCAPFNKRPAGQRHRVSLRPASALELRPWVCMATAAPWRRLSGTSWDFPSIPSCWMNCEHFSWAGTVNQNH